MIHSVSLHIEDIKHGTPPNLVTPGSARASCLKGWWMSCLRLPHTGICAFNMLITDGIQRLIVH